MNFALDGPPVYPALGGRTDQYNGFISIGPTIEYLERAYDASKYGWYSERPYIDGCIQSFLDPDMAPPGKHVMSCFVQYAPYHLKGSDWDTEREGFGDVVQATLESFFPGFSDLVLHREVVTPLDIERVTGLSEGNIYAGDFLCRRCFFRPAPGWGAAGQGDGRWNVLVEDVRAQAAADDQQSQRAGAGRRKRAAGAGRTSISGAQRHCR